MSELTEAESKALWESIERAFLDLTTYSLESEREIDRAVERILADRLAQVTADRDHSESAARGWESVVADRTAERDLLAKAIWGCRTWLGFDPDGDDHFHSTDWAFIAAQHIREAEESRNDHEEVQEDYDALVEAVRALPRLCGHSMHWPNDGCPLGDLYRLAALPPTKEPTDD